MTTLDARNDASAKRVLVVDDNRDIVANICDILNDCGYETDAAYDGQSALQLVDQRSYDVAVLDFKMPDLDGATLCQEIRSRRSEIVPIMVTAYAGSDGAKRAIEAGTKSVLPKPVDLHALLSMIETAANSPIIFLVDDDQEFAQSLRDTLNDQGYRVCLAHGQSEAVEKIRSADVRVAIVDLGLGDGDGRDVIDQISQSQPTARTIVVTGDRGAEKSLRTMIPDRLEAVCYKPIEVDHLLSLITGLAAHS